MGIAPDGVDFKASCRMSRRMLAMRVFLSGPWQRKQVSDMIGRISRLKATSALRLITPNSSARSARETLKYTTVRLSVQRETGRQGCLPPFGQNIHAARQ